MNKLIALENLFIPDRLVSKTYRVLADSRQFIECVERIATCAEFQDSKAEVVVIYRPEDLKRLNSKINQATKSPTPITLVINTITMDTHEYANIQGLYADIPQNGHVKIGSHVNIVTVLDQDSLRNRRLKFEFSAVGEQVDLDEPDYALAIKKRVLQRNVAIIEKESCVIDLKDENDWRVKLLDDGELFVQLREVEKNPLLKKIVIRNAKEKDQASIIDYFTEGKAFGFYDSQGLFTVQSDISIDFFRGVTEPEKEMVKAHVNVTSGKGNGAPKYRVNRGNLSRITKGMQIIDNIVSGIRGYLSLMADTGGYLRIEEPLAKEDWQFLIDVARHNKESPEKLIQIILSPGVKIPNIYGISDQPTSEEVPRKELTRVLVDDLDWYQHTRKKSDTDCVVRVYDTLRVRDLIGSLAIESKKERRVSHAVIEEIPFIKKLQVGGAKLVLLGTSNNPDLMTFLSTLRENPPYIMVYGQRIEVAKDLQIEMVDLKDGHKAHLLNKGISAQTIQATPMKEKLMSVFRVAGIPEKYGEIAVTLLNKYEKGVGNKYLYIKKLASQILAEQDYDRSTTISPYHLMKALNVVMTKAYRVDGDSQQNKHYETMKKDIHAEVNTHFSISDPSLKRKAEKQIDDMLMVWVIEQKVPPKKDGYHVTLEDIRNNILTLDSPRSEEKICGIVIKLDRTGELAKNLIAVLNHGESLIAETARVQRKLLRAESKIMWQQFVATLGETGIGKTELFKRVHQRLNKQPLGRVDMGPGTGPTQLLGDHIQDPLQPDRTHRVRGVLHENMALGYWTLLDEFTLSETIGVLKAIATGTMYSLGDELNRDISDRSEAAVVLAGNPVGRNYPGRYMDPFIKEAAVISVMKDMTDAEMVVKVTAPGVQRLANYLNDNNLATSEDEQKWILDALNTVTEIIHNRLHISRDIFGAREITDILAMLTLRLRLEKEHRTSSDIEYEDLLPIVLNVIQREGVSKLTTTDKEILEEEINHRYKTLVLSESESRPLSKMDIHIKEEIKKAGIPQYSSHERLLADIWRREKLLTGGIPGCKAGMVIEGGDDVAFYLKKMVKNPLVITYEGGHSYSNVRAKIEAAYKTGRRLIIKKAHRIPTQMMENLVNMKLTEAKAGFGLYLLGEAADTNHGDTDWLSPALRSRLMVVNGPRYSLAEAEMVITGRLSLNQMDPVLKNVIQRHYQILNHYQQKGIPCDLRLHHLLTVIQNWNYSDSVEAGMRKSYNLYLIQLRLSIHDISERPIPTSVNTDTHSSSAIQLPIVVDDAEPAPVTEIIPSTRSGNPSCISKVSLILKGLGGLGINYALHKLSEYIEVMRPSSEDRIQLDGCLLDGRPKSYECFEGENHSPRYDRWGVQTIIELKQGGKISLKTIPSILQPLSTQPNKVHTLKKEDRKAGEIFGDITLEFNEQEYALLPSLAPEQIILNYSSSRKLIFFQDKTTDLIYVRSTSSNKPKKLYWIVRDTQAYNQKHVNQLAQSVDDWKSNTEAEDYYNTIYEDPAKLASTRKTLLAVFKDSNDGLSIHDRIGIEPEDSVVSRAQKINRFFHDFKNKQTQLTHLFKPSDISLLIGLMKDKVGVCRHRAFMAMALGLAYNVGIRLPYSSTHEWGEAYLPVSENKCEWVKLEYREDSTKVKSKTVVTYAKQKDVEQYEYLWAPKIVELAPSFLPSAVKINISLNERPFQSLLKQSHLETRQSEQGGDYLDPERMTYATPVISDKSKRVVIVSSADIPKDVSRYLTQMAGGFDHKDSPVVTRKMLSDSGAYPPDQWLVLDTAEIKQLQLQLKLAQPQQFKEITDFDPADDSALKDIDWNETWLGERYIDYVLRAFRKFRYSGIFKNNKILRLVQTDSFCDYLETLKEDYEGMRVITELMKSVSSFDPSRRLNQRLKDVYDRVSSSFNKQDGYDLGSLNMSDLEPGVKIERTTDLDHQNQLGNSGLMYAINRVQQYPYAPRHTTSS